MDCFKIIMYRFSSEKIRNVSETLIFSVKVYMTGQI